jgi:hypothetical protein
MCSSCHCRCGVFRNHPPGVYDSRDPPQDTEQDIDEEVGVAAGLEEDSEWREKDCKEVEKDIAL